MGLFRSKPLLQFLCEPADKDVIAPPVPAKAYLPDWFRKLPAVDETRLALFEIVAGVVDTDTYRSPIHFPFFATGPDGLHVVEKGSPIVQVIPFRRDAAEVQTEIRAETKAEAEVRVRVLRQTMAKTGWYRTDARAKR